MIGLQMVFLMKQVKKVHRTKIQVVPDYKAITYLLTKHYDKEYSERYEDNKLIEEKNEVKRGKMGEI